MLNKYIYSECPEDVFPTLKSIQAISYNQAVEKLTYKLSTEYDDDTITDFFDNMKGLKEYMNDTYGVVLSDLEDVETL